MSYTVILPRSVLKQLAKLDATVQTRIEDSLLALQKTPRPAGAKKLKGRDGLRIRVGDYRVIYEIHDWNLQIIVIQVGHRRDIYRE
ncbi:MAG: type II toxin-antitoxin system RelE/ParE family toxin [Verrucomicrobiaceae bacterium]